MEPFRSAQCHRRDRLQDGVTHARPARNGPAARSTPAIGVGLPGAAARLGTPGRELRHRLHGIHGSPCSPAASGEVWPQTNGRGAGVCLGSVPRPSGEPWGSPRRAGQSDPAGRDGGRRPGCAAPELVSDVKKRTHTGIWKSVWALWAGVVASNGSDIRTRRLRTPGRGTNRHLPAHDRDRETHHFGVLSVFPGVVASRRRPATRPIEDTCVDEQNPSNQGNASDKGQLQDARVTWVAEHTLLRVVFRGRTRSSIAPVAAGAQCGNPQPVWGRKVGKRDDV